MFTGSNLAEMMDFLKAIEIHSMTFSRGAVKFSAPCHKILWHIKEPCTVPYGATVLEEP
jgi:hypothetical protein